MCPSLKQTKSKNNSISNHLFFYRLWVCISDLLFTYLWTLSTVLVFTLVKTSFDLLILNYILPFLYKSGIISIIYHKYGKSVIKIIPLHYIFDSVMKNCAFIFEKIYYLPETSSLVWRDQNFQHTRVRFFLSFCTCVLLSNAYKKLLTKSYFFQKLITHMLTFHGKIVNTA